MTRAQLLDRRAGALMNGDVRGVKRLDAQIAKLPPEPEPAPEAETCNDPFCADAPAAAKCASCCAPICRRCLDTLRGYCCDCEPRNPVLDGDDDLERLDARYEDERAKEIDR